MVLHDLISCQFILVVDPFTEFNDISWVYVLLVARIAHVSHTLESGIASLRIRVSHVEPRNLTSLRHRPGLSNGWSQNG